MSGVARGGTISERLSSFLYGALAHTAGRPAAQGKVVGRRKRGKSLLARSGGARPGGEGAPSQLCQVELYGALPLCGPATLERIQRYTQYGAGHSSTPMPLPQSHRMSAGLQEALSLKAGEPKRLRLTSELLLAMRRGELFKAEDHPTVEKLFVAKDLAEGWRELEDCLDEAWRSACALNLPLSEDMKQCVVDNLVKVRYNQSTATFKKPGALKPLLDRLVKDSSSLENELKRGLAPDGARSKMRALAKLCAQHLYRVRAPFENTYQDVQWPWEDFHNDLVMFIEELKASKPAAQVNVEGLTRSLWHFKEMVGLLDKYELKLKPKHVRVATASQTRVPDQSLSVLRNWHSQTSKVNPDADAHVRWHDLWIQVDLLLEYSERLLKELEQLQGHDPAPGCADKSVMLARLCALAVHSVKRSFLSTYKDVPWEEMEYLLVMFIEERTVYETLAHAVANAKRTADHLRCFRKLVKDRVRVQRNLDDPEAALESLKVELGEEGEDARAAIFARVVDPELTKLRRDFTLLRDWHSLKEMDKALEVSKQALSPEVEDEAWVAWGWLALGWALFVVGERVKYSWTSPNLSPRWTHLMEAIAPGGVLKVMAAIRDYQAHPSGKDSSNALSGMKKKERTKLAEELKKLKEAVHVALVKVESEVECYDCDRVDLARVQSESSDTETSIKKEVLEKLRPAASKATEEFEVINSFLDFKTNYSYFWFISVKFAKKHMPKAVPWVLRLLLYRSMEHTESLYAELQKVTPSVSSPLETLRRALTALAAAPEGHLPFAINGALRELASRWHEDDQAMPTAVPFSPALFGRQLRNYLNHLDEVFRSHLELNALYNLLRWEVVPLEHGARPRPRDPQRSRAQNKRLLRLIELKSDMFRCAREGGLLGELQHLDEDGTDVSARDCQDRTLLHAAAQAGQVDVVKWLLELGTASVDPLAVDWKGYTALHVAGTAAVAEELLLAYSPEEYLDPQKDVWTPLHVAALEGRVEVVEVLREYPCYLNAGPKGGVTPLYFAARYGHEEVVRLLLRAGARYQPDADDTPLVAAAMSGSAPTVRLLLDRFWTEDKDCWLAAEEAARLGHKDAFEVLWDELDGRPRNLLKWGPQEPKDLLFCASVGGSTDIMQRLLGDWPHALSEDLNAAKETAIHAASGEGHTKLVKMLLRTRNADPLHNADPLRKTVGDWTTLDYAAKCGSVDTINALVEHISNNNNNAEKKAALDHALCQAAVFGQLEVVEQLLQHGAEVDEVDKKGRRPLESAVSSGHTKVVKCLLREGADRTLGEIPLLNVAAMMGRLEVVEVLVEDPGPSALRVAVKAGSREDLQRILGRFVEHLRPFSSLGDRDEGTTALGLTGYLLTFARGIASIMRVFFQHFSRIVPGTPNQAPPAPADSKMEREERKIKERNARLKLKTEKRDELKKLLSLLNMLQPGRQGSLREDTALHAAVSVCALPIVEYLLNQEEEILKKYAKYTTYQNEDLTVSVSHFTVYARDTERHTALQLGASMRCAPRLAEALLKRMGDSTWMKVGGKAMDRKELRDVRTMAVEALQLAARHPDSGRLVRTLCEWTSSKGVLGAGGLQDIRSRAVDALCSGQACEVSTAAPSHREGALVWRSVAAHLAASPLNLAYLQQYAVTAMLRCLELGPRGEMALQLLCQWECDLSEDDVRPSKVLLMIGEAMDIAREWRDRDLYDVIGAINLSEINF